MARRVQQSLLAYASPEIPSVTIAKRCIPAESIGGDFYTFVSQEFETSIKPTALPGITHYVNSSHPHLGIVMGDVAGHGISSALIMALTSGLFSTIGQKSKSPAKCLFEVNNALVKSIENSEISFVTAFYGILNINTYIFTYTSAGHLPALLIRNHEILPLASNDPMLGLYANQDFQESSIMVEPKDRILLFTDGITEARNRRDEFFGQERLENYLLANETEPVETVLNGMLAQVELFTEQEAAKDDQTAILIEINEKI